MSTADTTAVGRGLTPVIGIILLVSITVILAAVVAAFTTNLGGETEVTPTATFDFDYDRAAGELTITHDSGTTIPAGEVYIRGDTDGGTALSGTDRWSDTGTWVQGGSTSADVGTKSAIASGDSLTLAAGPGYEVSVIWQSPSGQRSATIAEDSGPDR